MTDLDPRARDVLAFWFEETSPSQWFEADPSFDETIRRRFGALHEEAAQGGCDGWCATADGALALVILLDQFSRNLFRGKGRAFAQDAKARDVVDDAIAQNLDMMADEDLRAFFYIPYMHAEDLALQDKCIELIRERLGEASGNLPHAIWHREVIEKFGRFPFRNKALGRETTPEEAEYLANRDVPG